MKSNKELERSDMAIAPDIQISDSGEEIEAWIETWFDVDAKFGTNTRNNFGWVNFWSSWNPKSNALKAEYIEDLPDISIGHPYIPTEGEASLIKAMITEKIRELFGETPMEFLESA